MRLNKSDLIRMANLALMGQIEPSSTESLEDDDALFFWMMYSIGSAVAAGMLSKECGRAAVINANKRFVPSPKKQTKNLREKPNEKNDKYNIKLLYPTAFIPRFA